MKKIFYGIGIIGIVALVALLYTYATAFQIRNVDEMRLLEQEYTFDLEDKTTQLFIKKLQVLKQYQQVELSHSIISDTLVLDMKYSQVRSFIIELDHDFNSVYITDVKEGITYLVEDDLVTWLYMLPAFEDVYTYKEALTHDVIINDIILEDISLDYHYMTADDQWHSSSFDQDVEKFVYTVKELDVDFSVRSDKKPDTITLKVVKDGKLLYENALDQGIYQPEENGDYLYEVTSSWNDSLYNGSAVSQFIVKAAFPPEFIESANQMVQGEFIIIKGKNIFDPDSLFIDQSYMEGIAFEQNGEFYECLIPSTYYTTPGHYTLNYGLEDYSYELSFDVVSREFNLQFLTVDEKTTQSTQTTEAYAEYNKYYKPALLKNIYKSQASHLTNQAFILPVKGRLTTEFGVQRYVNDKATSYHHSGLDIAIDRGTDIMATYDGEVVLAMPLIVTGNTVVISHGNGIFSSYLHMDSLNVEEGQVLSRGDIIGTVGSTGFSTGPHLHFTISYYKMNLEPGYFIYGQAVTYDNYKTLFEQ